MRRLSGLLLAVAASACPDLSDVRDAMVMPDASLREPDAGPKVPARQLIDVPLFEDGVPTDRVFDPRIDAEGSSSHGWVIYSLSSANFEVNRKVLARAPAGQTALFVPDTPGNRGGVFIGLAAKLANSGMTASVWVGGSAPATVALLVPDGTTQGHSVILEADGEPRVIDGIRWRRYSAAVEAGIGWGWLIADTQPGAYFHAPSLKEGSARRLSMPRPLNALEREFLKRAARVPQRAVPFRPPP